MPTKTASLVLISITSPLKCGVYEHNKLKKSFNSSLRTADALTEVFSELFDYLKQIDCVLENIFYAKGPGSFTSLKLTHIFLQTLVLTQGLRLYSVDSFYFNQNTPIKAFGDKFFIKNDEGNIVLQTLQTPKETQFCLPEKIDPSAFGTQNEPLYILPPI